MYIIFTPLTPHTGTSPHKVAYHEPITQDSFLCRVSKVRYIIIHSLIRASQKQMVVHNHLANMKRLNSREKYSNQTLFFFSQVTTYRRDQTISPLLTLRISYGPITTSSLH